MNTPVLQLVNLHKRFGGESALRGVDLDARRGAIHGLGGESGAGKSVLVQIAAGLLRPDQGEIRFKGDPLAVGNPLEAAAQGIAVVRQHPEVLPFLSVAENMLLGEGLVQVPGGLIHWPATYRRAQALLADIGEHFDVRQPARKLSKAQRIMMDLAVALSREPTVVFIDDPTPALNPDAARRLWDRMRALRENGAAIVYVSSRLDEVQALCDDVTVLRDGVVAGSHAPLETIGLETSGNAKTFPAPPAPGEEVRLEVANLTDAEGRFHNISLEVRAGEIVGLHGHPGAGGSEFGQALFGLRPAIGGKVKANGLKLHALAPQTALDAGIAYLPADRLGESAFPSHSWGQNASVARLRRLSRAPGWISRSAEEAAGQTAAKHVGVDTARINQPITSFSAGDQQKAALARWLVGKPRILVLDEPVRAVDTPSKEAIRELAADAARQGTALLLITSDPAEAHGMCNRVLTLSDGRLTGEFKPPSDTQHAIAQAAMPADHSGKAETRTPGPGTSGRPRQAALLVLSILLAGSLLLFGPSEFASASNMNDLLMTFAFTAIMAQAAMIVLGTGGMDVSIGALFGLAAVTSATGAHAGLAPSLCLGWAIALGAWCGLANAGAALLARAHPLVITLAAAAVYQGLIRRVTGGVEIVHLPDSFRALSEGSVAGIPKVALYLAAITAITHIMMRHMVIGRRILAIGNGAGAARAVGVFKARVTLFAFAIGGILASVAGLMYAGAAETVYPDAGYLMEFTAIAAAIIGGSSVLGGKGTPSGALLGALLLVLLLNALQHLGAPPPWPHMVVGVLALIAAYGDLAVLRLRGQRP
ncbi:MAG: ATP-binding cassette domain-containing protein [Candidatus Hydrogenedentota bacterium]